MKFSVQSVYEWYRGLVRNPKYRWWVVLGTLAYFASPIDVLPDIFPIVGQLDDVFLLTVLVSEFSQLAIDGFKARRGVTDTQTPASTENATKNAGTIDVDAVSVK
ncbi:YkvA family protein [Rivularia sp. UHCC 0363]|uniref:YkvA family protein n=1 Tax=Rivularia sp. UHCC 0363 TaxID=3110244 RepID=UPI002B21097C|nr:YkvA family protein [Rivularia sp. UHCC 0363]MEA5596536.1 YkvA family protein [Rivularia sp. UHCC 0363]